MEKLALRLGKSKQGSILRAPNGSKLAAINTCKKTFVSYIADVTHICPEAVKIRCHFLWYDCLNMQTQMHRAQHLLLM